MTNNVCEDLTMLTVHLRQQSIERMAQGEHHEESPGKRQNQNQSTKPAGHGTGQKKREGKATRKEKEKEIVCHSSQSRCWSTKITFASLHWPILQFLHPDCQDEPPVRYHPFLESGPSIRVMPSHRRWRVAPEVAPTWVTRTR